MLLLRVRLGAGSFHTPPGPVTALPSETADASCQPHRGRPAIRRSHGVFSVSTEGQIQPLSDRQFTAHTGLFHENWHVTDAPAV